MPHALNTAQRFSRTLAPVRFPPGSKLHLPAASPAACGLCSPTMASPCTMLDDSSESDLSSVPPSPPAEYTSPLDTPSSPLSTLSSSPEPPDYFESDTGELYPSMGRKQAAHVVIPPYPSPPASQNTSVNGSPTPDGAESGVDGPPPAKRRKVSKEPKERSTHWLDLRPSEISEDDREHLDRVLSALHRRQKIVVIAGAGMSRSAGGM